MAERPNTAPSKIESTTKSKEAVSKAPKRPNTSSVKKSQLKKPSASSLTNLGILKCSTLIVV